MAKAKNAPQADGDDTDVAVTTERSSELSAEAPGGKTGEIGDMSRGGRGRHQDGLDQIVDLIKADPGLRASETATDEDIAGGARAANAMNDMIERAIRATGVAKDDDISAEDVVELNGWLRATQGRIDKWTKLHGDDEGGEETGFHLVQNDGANTQRFGENFVNTVADGIYHLGFKIENGRLLNEDGDENATLEDVADWLTYFHVDQSTTGTGLDRIVDNIKTDCGLAENTNAGDINGGAKAADALNHIIADEIKETNVMADTWITVKDIKTLNAAIRGDADLLARWTELHGDDEDGEATGFHLVQNNGGTSQLFGENYIDTVADGIYHLGFEIQGDNVVNEDGDANASLTDLSKWLNHFMLKTKLVDGTDGDDKICDGRGDQQVDAGNGNDVVTTGRGKDLIDGGAGDDKIDGGAGADYLFGGEGCDVFVFGRGSGRDIVADFEDGVDKLSLARLSAQRFDKVSITQVEDDTVISYGGSEIVLAGVNCENITQADFVI